MYDIFYLLSSKTLETFAGNRKSVLSSKSGFFLPAVSKNFASGDAFNLNQN